MAILRRRPPTAVPNSVHIRRWGFLGEWVKYNLIFLFIPFFLGTHNTGQTRRLIFAHDGSNDADWRMGVPFWVSFTFALHLGGKISPKTPKFGDVNRRFQAKLVKSKSMHIIKTTKWHIAQL